MVAFIALARSLSPIQRSMPIQPDKAATMATEVVSTPLARSDLSLARSAAMRLVLVLEVAYFQPLPERYLIV